MSDLLKFLIENNVELTLDRTNSTELELLAYDRIKHLEQRLKEADVIIKHLANSPHPYTVHEHRDTLEHRFGLQIEVARTYTEKYGEKEEGK